MQNSKKLFEIALQFEAPWFIQQVKFSPGTAGSGRLDIYIDFHKGTQFPDSENVACSVYDSSQKTWRHLDFFQHECYLHARVPRIKNNQGKVRLIEVPWARSGSGFTLLFEAFAMTLIEGEMPITKVARNLRVTDPRIWRIFKYWISRAHAKIKIGSVEMVGIDETSSRKGHKYVTIAADLKERRVIFACRGKDENTIKQFRQFIESKQVNPKQITHFSIDMSPAFISGIQKDFPDSKIVFDRFHIKKKLNEALDALRRAERREHDELKNHKYTFLKKSKDLTDKQILAKQELIELFPTLGDGVRMVEIFDDFFECHDKEQAGAFLAFWCDRVDEAGLVAFREFIKMLKGHWSGVLNWFDAKISNGILEGFNTKIQLAKRRARGFRNIDNLINMIYFISADLDFDYPH